MRIHYLVSCPAASYPGFTLPGMSHGEHQFAASLGDLIAVAAVAVAWLTFRLDRAASVRGEIRAATALLRGVREGFFRTIGDHYFSTAYDEATADGRARGGAGGLDHVFALPTEPVAALIADQRAVAAGLISITTIVQGTVALWQLMKINELIRERTIFNAVHAADLADKSLAPSRKEAIVEGGVAIMSFLHRHGVGFARDDWYKPLKESVEGDLKKLEIRGGWEKRLGRNLPFIPGDVVALGAVIAVATAYVNAH